MKGNACSTCEEFERLIRVAEAEKGPDIAEAWRDAQYLHAYDEHLPRQRKSAEARKEVESR